MDDRRGFRQRVQRWARVGAFVLGGWGLVELLRWANRWYVTEQLARTADADEWPWLYDLLHAAHESLVLALVLLGLAGALGWLALAVRRTAAPRVAQLR